MTGDPEPVSRLTPALVMPVAYRDQLHVGQIEDRGEVHVRDVTAPDDPCPER